MEKEDNRPMCRYGKGCYRKNPLHFQEFRHPPREEGDEEPPKKRQRTNNLSHNEFARTTVPFFFTKVRGIPDRYNDSNISVDLKDILNFQKDDMISSVQFNYMFDIPWLIGNYPQESREKPLLLVHGCTGASKSGLEEDAKNLSNIQLFQASLPIAYGTHHTKMMFLLYNQGMRVVIHTANLIEQDWDQKTQGVWISPVFPQIEKDRDYDQSEDKFKMDLLDYVSAYIAKKGPLSDWIDHIKQHDMSTAMARIVGSVPGRHTSLAKYKWGHLRLRELLQQIGPSESDLNPSWPIVGQFSSIGSLGKDHRAWLCTEWLDSLSAVKKKFGSVPKKADLKLVFPTVENVRTSLEGYSAGGSLPYSSQNAKKQLYLVDYLHQWKSSYLGRSRASPHIKTYVRVSEDGTEAAWLLLTSANLSKAAWGVLEKNNSQLMIRSYEIGVLFLPQNYCQESISFKLSTKDVASDKQDFPHECSLSLPYDLPLNKYGPKDRPWVWDARYTDPDSHDKLWMPSF